jgi:mRNA interferase RelE/StbE
LTTYRLTFLRDAKKEWDKLGGNVKQHLQRKLVGILQSPHRPSARLSGLPGCYKIKLRDIGYRLVYRVYDDRVVVQVVAVGRRDGNDVYNAAAKRLKSES